MQFEAMIVLVVLLLVVSAGFYKKNKAYNIQKKKTEELQQEFTGMKERFEEQEKELRMIWDAANTIHLYAAISEEETRLRDLKEKQSEIRMLSEEILRLSDKI